METEESNILDNNFLDLEGVKKKLSSSGIHKFYETEDNKLVVTENDAVRVEVKIVANTI